MMGVGKDTDSTPSFQQSVDSTACRVNILYKDERNDIRATQAVPAETKASSRLKLTTSQ